MIKEQLNQTGYIIEGFRAIEMTYGDYLGQYWSDETTTPNGVAPRLFIDQIDWSDESGYRSVYDLRSWGVNGRGPSRSIETFDTEEEAELAMCESWERHYHNDSTDNPGFWWDLDEAASVLAESTGKNKEVILRYWSYCEIGDARAAEHRSIVEAQKVDWKRAIEEEAAELVPDLLLLDDLQATNDLKGQERSQARSTAQVAFLHRVGHYPIRTDFWKVFKIVNAKII
jgi:hypothetical protein